MKKTLFWLIKAFFAGCLALALASMLCLIYYNPVPATVGEGGATQTAYSPSTFGSTMREGIAWGKTDAWGYYNTDVPQDPIQVLVMGSSHMQAVSVFHEERMGTLLGEYTGKTTYNIGVSGYTLLECTKNLETALQTMTPTEYLVIETRDTLFRAGDIHRYLDGLVPPDAKPYSGGLAALTQKIPYARLAYVQLKELLAQEALPAWLRKPASGPQETQAPPAQADYDAWMGYIADTCAKYGVQPVIFYHSSVSLLPDGALSFHQDPGSFAMMSRACEDRGILFVDMTEDIDAMYRQEYRLPHGFCNSAVGYGHLNRDGHRLAARRIAQVIEQLDAGKGGNGG